MDTAPKPKVFVLILHGFTIKVSAYESLRKAIPLNFPESEVHVSVPALPLSRFSCAKPQDVTKIALDEVDGFWTSLTEDQKKTAKIILVGHSTGALFARKAYVVACGVVGEEAHPGSDIKPWVENVDRLILLAGINKGWTLSDHLGFFKKLYYKLGLSIGHAMVLVGQDPIVFQTQKGSKFIEDLNKQSDSIKNEDLTNTFGNVLTVQLLGLEDDIVSPDDNVDISVGKDYVYLEMQYSDHFNVIDLTGEEGKGRQELIMTSLLATKEQLQTLQPANLSLPLLAILTQEYQYLNPNEEMGVEEKPELSFKDDTALNELLTKIATPNPDAPSVSDFEIIRLKKLLEWANLQREGNEPLEARHLKQALNEKLAWPKLLIKETWMEEATLKPYTQGLYQRYILHKTQGEVFPRPNLKSSDIIRYENAFKSINRRVLEDIYGDVLVSRDDSELKIIYKKLYEKNSTALCLSGGGIRSGTFALGVVQGLAGIKSRSTGVESDSMLRDITYISTVSGGGYTGGWLSAWIHQEDTDQVFHKLSGEADPLQEPAPLRHLRQYSNYMTPVVGLFSADTWTLFATYLRNMLLNWMIIIPFLAAVVTLPWLVITILTSTASLYGVGGMLVLGSGLLIYSDLYTKKNPPTLLKKDQDKSTLIFRPRPDQVKFMRHCLLPGGLGFLCWAIGWYWLDEAGTFALTTKNETCLQMLFSGTWSMSDPKAWQYILVAGCTGLFVLIEWVIFYYMEKEGKIPKRFQDEMSKGQRVKDALYLVLGGVCYGILLVFSFSKLAIPNSSQSNLFLYVCLAFPLFMFIQLFIGFLYEGLKSRFSEDSEREWRARYGGWFLIVALGWIIISGLTLFIPYFIDSRVEFVLSFSAITGYLTAYLGSKSVGKGDPEKEKNAGTVKKVFSYLSLPALAFLAFLALLVFISLLDVLLLNKMAGVLEDGYTENRVANILDMTFLYPAALGILLLVLGGYFSRNIGSNQFSLHAMYRSRIIRAFLGAARPQGSRSPDPFTGFDESDNIHMGSLVKPAAARPRPFHMINMALNLASGNNLAWQERKAASFTVSPLHAGSLYLGYRNTYLEGVSNRPVPTKSTHYYGGARGITLGTAMTISGAALSPNSGYHTSALVAFFMTLFNLRLGSWLGNPGPAGDATFNDSSPKDAINPILYEMFGLTDDQNDYVNLSDGGHFDNLGLYEMALRRNRFIVVSDGSHDDKCDLEDLGNAIRKVRVDLGVEIDFPADFDIFSRQSVMANKGRYWALGRIRYPENRYDPVRKVGAELKFKERDGVLLYIKPGIYGTEPKDIYNYATVNPAFPHESTADQFFSESQFESYRALGRYAVERLKAELMEIYGIELADLSKANDWAKDVIQKLNFPKKVLPASRTSTFPTTPPPTRR